jgi:aminodeoxyfutalosine deaminase
VLALAERHPDPGVPTDPARLAEFFRFTDFAHFVTVYTAINRLVTSGADVITLISGLAADLAAEHICYAEVTVTPMTHLAAGIDPVELVEALTVGRRSARHRFGVELSWVFDISGDLGIGSGLDTARWVLTHQPEGAVGFGLGGPETGVPRAWFHQAFRLVRAAGLHSVPHAGETGGPDEVWSALRVLGAERIGHGIRSVQDPKLLAQLADRAITLEVCPTSNVCTRAVDSLAEHPLPTLVAAGVPVTLGTDDPGMFGTTLNREYLLCHQVFGASRGELAELARAGVRAAFCPAELRTTLLAEIDAVEHSAEARSGVVAPPTRGVQAPVPGATARTHSAVDGRNTAPSADRYRSTAAPTSDQACAAAAGPSSAMR